MECVSPIKHAEGCAQACKGCKIPTKSQCREGHCATASVRAVRLITKRWRLCGVAQQFARQERRRLELAKRKASDSTPG